MQHRRRFSRAITCLLMALVLGLTPTMNGLAQTPTAATPTPGIQTSDMDLTVDPADDFYQFANGGWLKRTEIPPEWPSYGVFEELTDRTEQQLIGLLGAAAGGNTLSEGSDEWKAVAFYEQGLDLDTRNAQGIVPLQPYLDQIDAVTDLAELHELMASPEFVGLPDLFNITVTADYADSSMSVLYLVGPLLGLPAIEYYTEDEPANEPAREAYREAAANLFVLAGRDQQSATDAAAAVYAFEEALAEHMVTQEMAQDIAVVYNPMPLSEIEAIYPALDWEAYVTNAGATADSTSTIINSEVELMENLQGILEATPLETVKDFLSFHLLLGASPYLSEAFQDATFRYIQALSGVEVQAPTEEEVLADVNEFLGEAVGRLYVDEFFPPDDKAQITELVDNVIAAFGLRLEANPWMTPETKEKALEKLTTLRLKVGYPDTWRSYATVEIGDSYAQTVHNALVAETRRVMAKAGEPVDQDEWSIPPQVVNAYYNVFNNEIVFPAGILQPPFFSADADPASNYGAIGFVIGHEITHGFDLIGSQFDANGNFANWWTEEDHVAFQELNDRVVAQYGEIEVLPDLFVDGQLTVTENVADMGGLQVTYDALMIALSTGGDPGPIDGFTQEQRFFIAAASTWRTVVRDEVLTTAVLADVHSPGQVRGKVPLQNMDTFYEAFEIEPGDPMFLPPEERIVVW